jgi:hypothetical protein
MGQGIDIDDEEWGKARTEDWSLNRGTNRSTGGRSLVTDEDDMRGQAIKDTKTSS